MIRPLTLDDLENVHELLSNWEVVRYMLLPLCSREESEKFVREAIEPQRGALPAPPRQGRNRRTKAAPGAPFGARAANDPDSAAWRSIVGAIVDDAAGFAGLCGMVVLKGTEEGEIWYLVQPARWGQGLATAAARELIEMGFVDLGLHRVWASCLPENPASARVLEKAGMRREGLRKGNLKIHGEWRDSFVYAVLAEEWPTGRKLVRNPAAAIEENKALVLSFVDRLINQRDLSAADELLAADYVDHDARAGQQPGPEGVKATYASVSQVLADMRAVTEDVIAEGDRVVTRHLAEATRAGGERVRWAAISIYRIAGDRIAERWGLMDSRAF